ncbi:hypothetical protein PV08_01778 [Exophiala spinifera]|uniref:AB hydrolase-1 domain-containing protein n=1 Tax=Exophiala spinifera TaxID=91928 RepID=A0A0D2BQF4_9EURO|nr:uncharacterized protein PV08_01778 [Exophiala spinifera]KIW21198.1 hypothetical protein PV08_01778 [Exophiala spinifera]
MVPERKTLHVSHLGGIQVGYRASEEILDHSKPTLVLFNPFTVTADYYIPEFENESLLQAANLVALEPLGHGDTFPQKVENFTYWDSAIMALEALDKLGVERVFVAGTSQGGWIAVRMALVAPTRITGIVAIGSSMDFESPRSRELGCWDGPGATSGLVTLAGNTAPADDFEPGSDYCDFLMDIGFGKTVDQETKEFWSKAIRHNYCGGPGKRRICQAAVTLATRDGLLERLPYIHCPVLWLHGTDDIVFSAANAEEGIARFTNAAEARLIKFPGGVHFLSWTHRKEVARELLGFINKWGKDLKASL